MLGRVKQVRAGMLDVGYVGVGPAHGQAVLLLHGWPYDIHSFAEVAPSLADAGYRVVVPFLRGYGTTRFLSDDTNRNGQQAISRSTYAQHFLSHDAAKALHEVTTAR